MWNSSVLDPARVARASHLLSFSLPFSFTHNSWILRLAIISETILIAIDWILDLV